MPKNTSEFIDAVGQFLFAPDLPADQKKEDLLEEGIDLERLKVKVLSAVEKRKGELLLQSARERRHELNEHLAQPKVSRLPKSPDEKRSLIERLLKGTSSNQPQLQMCFRKFENAESDDDLDEILTILQALEDVEWPNDQNPI